MTLRTPQRELRKYLKDNNMAEDRYIDRGIRNNSHPMYKTLFFNRGVNFISHHQTPDFDYPDDLLLAELSIKEEVWKTGDRMFKYAHTEYGDVNYWWVIAFFNKKPTDSHFELGDVVYIPHPLESVLEFLEV